ncbi:MAG: type II secretion system protein GspJ [Candidatus Binatia bacterium]|nr:type II secretion system protein GspJ [Candidatus Binatia bacterium]
MTPHNPAEAGFTLLELLVGISILAIIVVAQVTPFQQTIESRDRAEASVQMSSAARITLMRLSEELTGALAFDDERLRFSLLDRTFDEPASELRFATTGARRVQGGARDPIDVVRYYLERDPDRPGSMLLMKQQLPSVAAQGVEPVTMLVLEDVQSFQAELLPPGGSWLTQQEPSAEVPRAVRLTLSVDDGTAVPTSYRTTVTLPMGAQ